MDNVNEKYQRLNREINYKKFLIFNKYLNKKWRNINVALKDKWPLIR